MSRGIGAGGCAVALIAVALFAATVAAEPSSSAHVQAVERYRAAAVLQQRALYDLAIAEYVEIEREFAVDPLADRARLQRGVCLFQLNDYKSAAQALEPLQSKLDSLTPVEAEQSLAYFGLAQYNLSHTADAAGRDQLLDVAIVSLAQQTEKFPTGELAPLSAYYHAEALYARGRLDEAVAAYRALLSQYPAHDHRADIVYALGVAEQERREFAAAAVTFAALEKEYPEHATVADARSRRGDVLLALAESQLSKDDDKTAFQTVEKIRIEFPESALVPPALVLQAQVQLRLSDFEKAEATLDECIARSTHAEVACQARLLRAQVRYRRGNFAGALADATSVPATDTHHAAALHLRGLAEAGVGRPADAVQTLLQLLAADPQNPRADHVLYDLAFAYEAANQHDDATATFARLVSQYPKSEYAAECYFRIGEAKYAAKDFAEAANWFTKACEARPATELLSRALHKFAWCSFERGDYHAAEAAFARQVAAQQGQIDSLTADALHLIAECRFQQRQYEQSLTAFDTASPQTSADESIRAMSYVHASEAAGELHQWQRMFELAERAVQEFPASDWQDEARCERGVALVELGRFDEAERDLTAIAAGHEGLLPLKSQLALARIERAQGDNDAAVRALFKVAYGHGGPAAPAAYHPLQAEAIYAAAQILEDTGRNDAAGKLYQELVDNYPASARSQLARQSLDRILRR